MWWGKGFAEGRWACQTAMGGKPSHSLIGDCSGDGALWPYGEVAQVACATNQARLDGGRSEVHQHVLSKSCPAINRWNDTYRHPVRHCAASLAEVPGALLPSNGLNLDLRSRNAFHRREWLPTAPTKDPIRFSDSRLLGLESCTSQAVGPHCASSRDECCFVRLTEKYCQKGGKTLMEGSRVDQPAGLGGV